MVLKKKSCGFCFLLIMLMLGSVRGEAIASLQKEAECLDYQRLSKFITGKTITGKSVQTGNIWKDFFARDGRALIQFSSGKPPIEMGWQIEKDKVFLILGAYGRVGYRVCSRDSLMLWQSVKTGIYSSEIISNERGNTIKVGQK